MAGVKRPRLPQGQWTLIVDHGTDLACLWHIHSIGLSIDGMAGCTRKFLDVRGHAFFSHVFRCFVPRNTPFSSLPTDVAVVQNSRNEPLE
ncbi:hypothetical protein Spb1_37500 [Planctopirus ephydatiae]|uniref:Uncharacterized protein n=1 Tax=Planctopirus ephydatiae TaxID=2528019 RepID=A0A518GT87_9PLAN|nr:hypothetical protein Spb1_37500 [Planctopirus ephydatiae]